MNNKTTEKQIKDLVLKGFHNAELALKIGISKEEVELRLKKIYSEYNVSNKMQLVFALIKNSY